MVSTLLNLDFRAEEFLIGTVPCLGFITTGFVVEIVELEVVSPYVVGIQLLSPQPSVGYFDLLFQLVVKATRPIRADLDLLVHVIKTGHGIPPRGGHGPTLDVTAPGWRAFLCLPPKRQPTPIPCVAFFIPSQSLYHSLLFFTLPLLIPCCFYLAMIQKDNTYGLKKSMQNFSPWTHC